MLTASMTLTSLVSVAVQWTAKAPFPGGNCQDGVGFAVNGKGYMGLGTISGPTYSKSIWEYDPGSDVWSQKADFGGGRRWYATGFTIGVKGYVGAGVDTLGNFKNDLWEYDPTGNTWTQKSNYPGGGRVGMTTFEINGKGYMGMGAATFAGAYFADMWSYDPTLNTWSAKAPVGGAPRGGAQGFANGNYGYCALGTDATTYYADMWRYDAAADAWQQASSFPGIGRGNFRSFIMGPIAFMGMGTHVVPPLQYVNDWWSYNTGFDTWTAYPAPPLQAAGGGSFAIGTKGYVREPGSNFVEFDPFDCLGVLAGPDVPGSACNDNSPCTMNDVWSNACVCTGTFQDSDGDGFCDALDNCPFVPGLIGDPCNDNNPNTTNDLINGSCVCVGTCNGNQVTLTLNTDGNASQTGWDIVVGNTNSVVCSGSGYTNNSTINVSCCLGNGCYDLRVYDSFGDGINPGGYVLRDAATNRIIDNSNNGPNFSSLSEVLDATSTPVSFCVPMGTDALVPTSCDQTGLTTNSVIQAQINANVSAQYGFTNTTSGYQFWVFAPNTGYSRRLFQSHAAPGTGWPPLTPVAQRAAYLKLSAMTSVPTIPSNVQLNVRVRSRVANVYGEFGPACRLTIGTVTNCSTTQLTTTATPVVSCGATLLNRLTGVLWSNNVLLANKYQFEFVNANTLVFLRNISSPTRNLNMNTWGNMIALPTCFIPYNIRVRVSFNNGATWCPWGAVCQVTFTCPPQEGREMESVIADHGNINIWPNPNDGHQLTLVLSGIDANADHIDVVILDAFGKEVMAQVYPASNGEVNTTIGFVHALATGIYVVRIDAAEERYTRRLIIE